MSGRAGHRRRVSDVTGFILTDLCALVAWVYFFGLNRVEVLRPYRGSGAHNLIFVSNHQSPLDSFLITLSAHFPRVLFRPDLHPWQAAAAEYWFASPVTSWFARRLRCVPVRTGNDGAALRALSRRLESGTLVFFPEGRRSASGKISRGLPGAGFVARRTRARVVPVAIDGLLDAMPYDRPVPRLGKKVRISFGDPIACDDLFARRDTRVASQALVDRAMTEVEHLLEEIRRTP
jgi:1-acyl-sn-glycerol-3-phosphate acyltransferase